MHVGPSSPDDVAEQIARHKTSDFRHKTQDFRHKTSDTRLQTQDTSDVSGRQRPTMSQNTLRGKGLTQKPFTIFV